MSSMRTSTSTASASGITATVTVEVCLRPEASVSGTLCTLCTPLSYLRREYAPLPSMATIISLRPLIPVGLEFITSIFQP